MHALFVRARYSKLALRDLSADQPFAAPHLHYAPPIIDRQYRIEAVATDAGE